MSHKSLLGIEFEYDDELTDPDKLAAFLSHEIEASLGEMLDSQPEIVGYGDVIPLEKGVMVVVEDTYDGDDREDVEKAAPLSFEICRDAYGIRVTAIDEKAGELGSVALELFHNELRGLIWANDNEEPLVTTLRANVAAVQQKNDG